MRDEPQVKVFAHPTTGQLAMVILDGTRVVDLPLSRDAAQKLLRDVKHALRASRD